MRRALPIVLALTAAMPAGPARALTNPVTCVLSVSISFTPQPTLTTTGEVGSSIDGSGNPCAPIPGGMNIPELLTTATLDSSPNAAVLGCSAIVASGNYTLTFLEHFLQSSGLLVFVGTPEGGTLTLLDATDPRSVGEAALVANPFALANAGDVASCVTGSGMTELNFVGALVMLAS